MAGENEEGSLSQICPWGQASPWRSSPNSGSNIETSWYLILQINQILQWLKIAMLRLQIDSIWVVVLSFLSVIDFTKYHDMQEPVGPQD